MSTQYTVNVSDPLAVEIEASATAAGKTPEQYIADLLRGLVINNKLRAYVQGAESSKRAELEGQY